MEYSGKTSSYHHKWNDTPNSENTEKSVRKVTLLDAQWTDCPVEVEDQVKDLWRYAELGNDNYIYRTSLSSLRELHSNKASVEKWFEAPRDDKGKMIHDSDIKWGWKEGTLEVDYIIDHLEKNGVTEDEIVLIHWWW